MYRSILVPLDGSPFAERALPMATALAAALSARLILVRAASAPGFPANDAAEAQVQAVQEAEQYLTSLAATLSERDLSIDVTVPYGDAAESILLEIELRDADLVVMCTHGRSGLGRWIYGSVAEQVLARSPAPVLFVRPTGEANRLAPQLQQTTLLVPLDGSALAETAIPHAEALARALGGSILLLRVLRSPISRYAYPGKRVVDTARRLRAGGIPSETVVREGWPADVIAYQGAALGANLIVMATHGRTGAARMLLGSVALEVVRRSPLPVMLVRPPRPSTDTNRETVSASEV